MPRQPWPSGRFIVTQPVQCWGIERARRLRRNQTHAEYILWQQVRARRLGGFKFRRQHPILGFVVDFYCDSAGLVVEIDGEVHAEQAQADAVRQRALEARGLSVIRFTNGEVEYELKRVLDTLLRRLHTAQPQSDARR